MADNPPGIPRDTKVPARQRAPRPPSPQALPDPSKPRSAREQSALNDYMIDQLDAFLDDLAEGHQNAMDQVVFWLTGFGDLEAEIRKSVEALNPLLQKWSIEVCFLLRMKEPRRFNELKENLPGIGSRTLSIRLKELESLGIVARTVYPEVPVRVEYTLTPKGKRLGDLFLPVIAHLRITGWKEGLQAASAAAKPGRKPA